MSDYKIKFIEDSLNINVEDFLKKTIPFEYDAQVFKWEYGATDKVFGYIQNDTRDVVGVQGMIPVNLRSDSFVYRTAKSETSYLDSSVQGKGLFKKLYHQVIEEARINGISFIWGFTKLGAVWNKMGFETKGSVLFHAVLRVNVAKEDNLKLHEIKRWLRHIKNKLERRKIEKLIRPYTNKAIVFKFEKGEVDAKIIENYFIENNEGSSLSLDMSVEFITKRVINNPFLEYQCIIMRTSDDEMIGYVILTAEPDPNGIVYISDIHAKQDDFISELIAEIYSHLKQRQDVQYIKYFGNILNPQSKNIFNKFDFFGGSRYDSEMYIVYRQIDNNSDQEDWRFNDFSRWNINGLWTEGITQ